MTELEAEIAAPAQQSVLGHVFDNYQNMMQIARSIREAGRQRGVAQPHVLELSRLATGLPVATIIERLTAFGASRVVALPDNFVYRHIRPTPTRSGAPERGDRLAQTRSGSQRR